MDESDFPLSHTRVAIIGLGLMGGSLALALRRHCAALYGLDTDPATLTLAQNWGLADALSDQPADLLPQADLIILATPIRTILHLLAELPQWHPGTAVVMDIGSTKSTILNAMAQLPDRFHPIGAHPMCGKEHGTLIHAYADMYQQAPFALTPLPRTTPRARHLAVQIAHTLGARPFWLDAATHDRWVAATSHLPYLIANTLASVTPREVHPLVGPGFLSTSRLAVTPVPMMLDILMTNREAVLAALTEFQAQLSHLHTTLNTATWPELTDLLSQGAARRQDLIHPPH